MLYYAEGLVDLVVGGVCQVLWWFLLSPIPNCLLLNPGSNVERFLSMLVVVVMPSLMMLVNAVVLQLMQVVGIVANAGK